MDTIRLEESQDVLVQTAAVIAAQRQFAQRLRQRTVPDPLTGLPVRSLLIDRLELALAAAGPDTGRLAVLCCDLEGITGLADQHGATVADVGRAEAAGRLVGAVRQGDVVARISAQTFVLLCPGIQDPADAAGIAQRVADAFAEPLHPRPDITHPVRLSVGVALSGRASTPESLIAAAHEAMTAVRLRRSGSVGVSATNPLH
jgi:diguanylate cyclase (GGDEF)-like protein